MEDAALSFRTLDQFLYGNCLWETAGDSSEEDEFATKKLSPLDIAVMMKADLETIRRVYEMHPPALTPELLRDCCRRGCQRGVVRFFAEKLPEGVSQVDSDGEFPIHLVMTQWLISRETREDDMKALIDIYPEAINIRDDFGWAPWESMLYLNCSSELVSLALQKLSKSKEIRRDGIRLRRITYENPATRYRHALDMDFVEGMSPVFSCIPTFRAMKNAWRVDAFVQCFRILLSKPNITKIQFAFKFLIGPAGFPVNENPAFVRGRLSNPMIAREAAQSVLKLALKSAVEELTLDFGYSYAIQNLPQLLWDMILRLPRLQALSVNGISNDVMPLLTVIEASKNLLYLIVKIDYYPSLHRLLDAVAQNTVLKQFDLAIDFERNQNEVQSHRGVEELRGYMASKLELENITLRKAKIFDQGVDPKDDPFTASQAKIQYYTNLNRNGRAVARKEKTKVADFVQLLCVEEDSDYFALENCNIRYGLLRELPSLWCRSVCGDGSNQNRKRKRKRKAIQMLGSPGAELLPKTHGMVLRRKR